MRSVLVLLLLIAGIHQTSFAQIGLGSMVGQYSVDMNLAKSKLAGTRAGEERYQKLQKDNFILMIYKDEASGEIWAAIYNMGFNATKPIWNAICVQGEMAQFTIELDEMYDDKKRIYHCSYVIENGVAEITIDPFFAHMTSEANSGQELVFIRTK